MQKAARREIRREMPRMWLVRTSALALTAGFAMSLGACDRSEEEEPPTTSTQESQAQGGVTQYDSGTTTSFEQPATER
jgi:hypothetical protein